MFPGMMQGPQPLPEEESYAKFWQAATKMAIFTLTVVTIAKSIQYVDRQAHDIIIDM